MKKIIVYTSLKLLFIFLDTAPAIPSLPCAVPDCDDKQSPRHRFPHPQKNKKRYDDWIQLISNSKLVSLNPLQVYRYYRVCHQHFTVEEKLSKYILNSNALPTLKIPRYPLWR